MTTTFVDVDVRPILRAGGEPFEQIMEAVNVLKPGEGLRLLCDLQADAAAACARLERLHACGEGA